LLKRLKINLEDARELSARDCSFGARIADESNVEHRYASQKRRLNSCFYLKVYVTGH
jgi:hypothetical protein